jgi:hypothetical protein
MVVFHNEVSDLMEEDVVILWLMHPINVDCDDVLLVVVDEVAWQVDESPRDSVCIARSVLQLMGDEGSMAKFAIEEWERGWATTVRRGMAVLCLVWERVSEEEDEKAAPPLTSWFPMPIEGTCGIKTEEIRAVS